MIRHATTDDLPRLLEMGARFWSQAPWGDLKPYIPEYCAADHAKMLVERIHDPNSILLTDGQNCMALATLAPMDVAASVTVCMVGYWWAEPEARGRLGIEMLDRMEQEAAKARAAIIFVAPAVASRGHAVGRLLERRGYNLVDLTFAKGVN